MRKKICVEKRVYGMVDAKLNKIYFECVPDGTEKTLLSTIFIFCLNQLLIRIDILLILFSHILTQKFK